MQRKTIIDVDSALRVSFDPTRPDRAEFELSSGEVFARADPRGPDGTTDAASIARRAMPLLVSLWTNTWGLFSSIQPEASWDTWSQKGVIRYEARLKGKVRNPDGLSLTVAHPVAEHIYTATVRSGNRVLNAWPVNESTPDDAKSSAAKTCEAWLRDFLDTVLDAQAACLSAAYPK